MLCFWILTGLQRATSTTPLTANAAVKDSAAVSAAAAAAAAPPSLQEVQRVAKEITQHCLSRWDAWLGLKAGSDSTGGKTGIWRVKFDGVRCAVLLLAFHKLNKELQGQQDSSGQSRILVLDQLDSCGLPRLLT